MEELQGAGGWNEEVEKVEEDVGALVEWGPPPVLQHPREAKHRAREVHACSKFGGKHQQQKRHWFSFKQLILPLASYGSLSF